MADPPNRAWTRKERQFVAEYLIDKDGANAAIRAGYSEHSAKVIACELLKKPHIKARVEADLSALEKKAQITAEYVLSSLKEIAERCMERVPVMETVGTRRVQVRDEHGHGVWAFDASSANRALELLGKHKKLFTDKVEIKGVENLAELLQEARLRRKNGASHATA